MAQLMRLYVVTPEGPIRVTLNPEIQPASAPCPTFGLGTEVPVELSPGALWVLRLPYPCSFIENLISFERDFFFWCI